MKKQVMSMLLVLCMVFTLLPSVAFAEETEGVTIGNTAIGTTSVTEGAPLCENHKTHDKDCGYIEAKEAQPCGDLLEDGSYSCAPVKDSGDVSGNTATPGNAEEKYVCDHSDGCGYKEAVDGADCTHECELCKDVTPALLAATPRAAITDDDYSYDPDSKTLTITSDAGTTAWRSNTNITDVTTVVIESGVTTIGKYAFYQCEGLASVTFEGTSQLATIGKYAFDGCKNLDSVTIPSSVTTIGDGAFQSCISLESVDIPSRVASIGESAFAYCKGFASVTIPSSVTSIGESAFAYCEGLANVTFEGTSQFETIGKDAFRSCKNLDSVTIPSSVTTIGDGAFQRCNNLDSLTIPSSVTHIGNSAFYQCEGLASVTFEGTSQLETIGTNAFSYCISLADVAIPSSVTKIDSYAFAYCPNLASVTFEGATPPATFESNVFAGNRANLKIYVPTAAAVTVYKNVANLATWKYRIVVVGSSAIISEGYCYDPDSKTLTIVSNTGTTAWRDNTRFNRANVTTVVIESDVIGIGEKAFDDCKNLTNVTIPESVTTIGKQAFTGCKNLASVTIPEDVTSIGDYAFLTCTSLASVTFEGEAPPTTFGDRVFADTANTLKIYVPKDSVQVYKTGTTSDYADKIETTTKITTPLDLSSVTVDVNCTDSDVVDKITGMTQHTHADNKPCWAWNNATKTLTLNNVDIEVSGNRLTGIVLPQVTTTILFSGSNTVKADGVGIYCDKSFTLTGESNSASLTISVKQEQGIAFGPSMTVTEGIVNVTSERNIAIVSSYPSTFSINLSGGTVRAKGGNGNRPFDKEPTLSNGMVHKADTGTWDNTAGTACVYEKSMAATVTEVAVTPETASVQKGTTQQFNATVKGTNNPAQTVTWTVTGGTKSTINESGLLTVATDETAANLTVTATSTVDITKSDTATVTVTTTPVTKYTLTVTGGTGGGSFEENATVTITANAPATGKVFDKWTTTDGVTFGDANAATTTITMPAKAVTVTATYKDEAETVAVTGVTLNKSTISLYSNTNPRSENLTATVVPSNATNKAVTWSSSNPAVATVANGTVTAVANGTATITVTTADSGFTASCTVTVSTYSSGGSTGGGGGGSSSGGSSNIIVTPPAPDKPNTPTETQIKVDGKTDANGNTTITVTDKNITDAIAKAEADAKKNGNTANGVTIVLSATGGKNATNVTVNLPKTVQDLIISKKVVSTIIVVDNPDVQIGMDLKAVTEINAQAKSDVNITAQRLDSGKLTGTAKTAIGSRLVFNLAVNIASATGISSGKQVQSFGAGSVSVTIPYTLGANEKAGNVCAVYVDGSGKVQWLTSSVYDSAAKVLRFSTNHFSTYGVGYKQDAPAFTDIANHPAKSDIEYVVSRGLFSGTGNTTFSPNTAMTRGMFVTALGRLANADVSSYKTSSFSDVKADSYYMGYIEWANKYGIVNGSDGKFMPDQSITREQMAVIMQNYAKVIGFTMPRAHEEKAFADSGKIGGYAKDAVKVMQMAGVLSGKSGNVFDPQGTATRAEVSAVLRRFVELRISIDTAQGWTMNDSGKWMYFENGKPVTAKKDIDGVSYTFDQNGETAEVPKNLKYTTHTVVKNENWGLIAKKYGCSANELAKLNNKTVVDIIHLGEVLIVPQ